MQFSSERKPGGFFVVVVAALYPRHQCIAFILSFFSIHELLFSEVSQAHVTLLTGNHLSKQALELSSLPHLKLLHHVLCFFQEGCHTLVLRNRSQVVTKMQKIIFHNKGVKPCRPFRVAEEKQIQLDMGKDSQFQKLVIYSYFKLKTSGFHLITAKAQPSPWFRLLKTLPHLFFSCIVFLFFFFQQETETTSKSEKGNSFCYENGCRTERIYRSCDMFLLRGSEGKKSIMLV